MTPPHSRSLVEWVHSYEGHPILAAPITVYPPRNRVSINTRHGCTLRCAYCICAVDKRGLAPEALSRPIATVGEILGALEGLRGQLDGFRLSVGDWSDPFLSAGMQRDTVDLVTGLAAAGCKHPIAVTSKVCPPDSVLRDLASAGLWLSVYVSLGDAGQRVERVPVEERVRLARRSRAAGLHTVLLLRPLHPAWTRPTEFAAVLGDFAGAIDEVVLGGLRAPAAVRTQLAAEGVELASATTGAVPTLDPELESAVLRVVSSALPGVPVARRRACAANRRFALPCLTPATGAHPLPEGVSAAVRGDDRMLWRDWNGYCRLVPFELEAGIGLSPRQQRALQALALLFEAAPALPWRLVGGAARVLDGAAAACTDLDVFVEPGYFAPAVERLADGGRGLRLGGCKGTCSRCSTCELPQPECRLVQSGRRFAVADIGGVQVDLSEQAVRPNRALRRMPVGTLSIPVDVTA